jgi:hypothetical protein
MGETRRKLTRRIDDKAARKRSFYRGWFWGWCSIARGYPDADRRRESLSELLSLLPVHRREAAVELRSEFHTFVHVDRTFHGVSAAISVVAACKHAAFSQVFSSLVTRRDLLVRPNMNEG